MEGEELGIVSALIMETCRREGGEKHIDLASQWDPPWDPASSPVPHGLGTAVSQGVLPFHYFSSKGGALDSCELRIGNGWP